MAAAFTAAVVVGFSMSGSDSTPSGLAGFRAASVRPDAPGPPHDEPGRRVLVPGGLDGSGRVPADVTVFSDKFSAVTKLDPALLAALRRAATDATADRVGLYVTSGWRSASYQQQLLDEAVSEYGSEAEAARWVATPQKSAHVSGDAVDIGPATAEKWLSKHGAQYGLCQIYRNEPWHYELRPDAVAHGCPSMYADPTEDPRMR